METRGRLAYPKFFLYLCCRYRNGRCGRYLLGHLNIINRKPKHMNYRSKTDIFPLANPYLPDETEVLKQCRSWLYTAFERQQMAFFSEKINAIIDPYRREYTVSIMHDLLLREATDEESDMCLSSNVLEQIEADFCRIIRRARADQVVEEMDLLEDKAADAPLSDSTLSTISRMEANIAYLNQEVANIKQLIEQHTQPALRWPTYCSQATDADKRDFEQYLSSLCSKPTKSQTSDIKLYLRLKEEQHIIIRPSQQSEEYDLICSFGYQRAKKTYYNS